MHIFYIKLVKKKNKAKHVPGTCQTPNGICDVVKGCALILNNSSAASVQVLQLQIYSILC